MADNAGSILQEWLQANIILQPFSGDETIDQEIEKFLAHARSIHGLSKMDFDDLYIDLNQKFEAYYRHVLNAGLHDGP
ncbi:MAG: hypothetical protein JWS10_3314 [Cypionkella sp.]|uniref:hypothetical protein n=1 Tax=Cypionkella sp. TaxID=2811411 RepID=UPI00260AD40B|nr:hypothetical protein [Cypionkella sp.]MDB5660699.1 hypothetical protein [Cypionkella sp.]